MQNTPLHHRFGSITSLGLLDFVCWSLYLDTAKMSVLHCLQVVCIIGPACTLCSMPPLPSDKSWYPSFVHFGCIILDSHAVIVPSFVHCAILVVVLDSGYNCRSDKREQSYPKLWRHGLLIFAGLIFSGWAGLAMSRRATRCIIALQNWKFNWPELMPWIERSGQDWLSHSEWSGQNSLYVDSTCSERQPYHQHFL